MSSFQKHVLFNPWIIGFIVILWHGFIGPYLISAPDTVAVIIGIAGIVLIWIWLFHYAKFRLSSTNPNPPKEKQ